MEFELPSMKEDAVYEPLFGSDDFKKSFKQVEKYSLKPVKTLGLTTKQVKKDEFNLDSFLE